MPLGRLASSPENNSFICIRSVFISSSTKNHGFRGMIFMQPKNPTRRTFFPMRVDTLRSSWWNRLVRGRLDVKLDSYRRNANCEAASFSVSFCATSRISFGTHSGNGVTSSLCLPAGVCTSLTAASLCLENRPANVTRAGHRRRWM